MNILLAEIRVSNSTIKDSKGNEDHVRQNLNYLSKYLIMMNKLLVDIWLLKVVGEALEHMRNMILKLKKGDIMAIQCGNLSKIIF